VRESSSTLQRGSSLQADTHAGNGSSKPRTAPAATPACDIDAEAAVVSAVMLKPAWLDELRDLLAPTDFYSGPLRAVYEACLELDAAGKPIDVVLVSHHLQAAGKLKQIGGSAFLGQITDATPSVPNVRAHARIVHDLGLLRRMGTTLHNLAILARAPETRVNVAAFLEQCEGEVFHCNQAEAVRETASTMHDMMAAAAAEFDTTKPRAPRGVTTGLRDLDELSLAFQPGELWYVAARPGKGKTALALGMAEAVACTGRAALVFSMEMKRPEIADRMISAMSGAPYKGLLKRELSPQHLGDAMTAIGDLGRIPLIVDDVSVLTPSVLRSRVRRHAGTLRARHPLARLALVVVDYVQLMAADGRHRTRNDELEAISRSLKILAGDMGCTVVALSQLTRPDRKAAGGGGRPSLTDLRGSGALEQDADKVVFIHRDDDDDEQGHPGDAELILAKGRNAGTGRVRALWQPWCVRFVDQEQAGFAWQRDA